jgi:hypothetical protein
MEDILDNLKKLPKSKQDQIYYLIICLLKNPDLSIPQTISQATKFAKGTTVPFSVANLEKCLKDYATKK